jgi:hypothetical protein
MNRIQTQQGHVRLTHLSKELHDGFARDKLLGVATARITSILLGKVSFNMQVYLGILWLITLTMIALLLAAQKLVQGPQSSLLVTNFTALLEFKLILKHPHPTTVKADTSQDLERRGDESQMIYGLGELDVPKVARIGLVGNGTKTRVVGTTIYRLPIHVRFIAGDSSWDLATIDCDSLSDTVLTLLQSSKKITQTKEKCVKPLSCFQSSKHIHSENDYY